jgi:hypothetical protein
VLARPRQKSICALLSNISPDMSVRNSASRTSLSSPNLKSAVSRL